MPADRPAPRPLPVVLLFAGLAVLWTWPLATRLDSRIAFGAGDPFLNTWILWWNAQALPFTAAWWNPPIFYPMPGALALSEHLAGIGLFTTPLLVLGATPALAYNSALLLSYTLSGFFTYALVLRLSHSRICAICAGLAFAFAPYRAGQLPHLQVLTAQWLPLQLLALHAYLETGRRRWLTVFGAAWAVQGLSNGYYLLFAPVLLALWIAWFPLAQRRWREAATIGASCVLASLPLLPVVLTYRHVHEALGLVRTRTEMLGFSAGLTSFFNPPHLLAFWPPRSSLPTEEALFPGLTVLLVIAVSMPFAFTGRTREDAHRIRTLLFYVTAALVMAALTFGPAPANASPLDWLRPYEWLVQVPGFNGLRVPARFAMLMALALAVACGLGLRMLLPVSRPRRLAAGALVALGLSADGWMERMPMAIPPGRLPLADMSEAAVLELPPDDTSVNVAAMFRAMSHGRPLVNGFSGYIPAHYDILTQSLRRDDPSALTALARGTSLVIVVAQQNDQAGDFRRLVESIPGIAARGLSAAGMTYVLSAPADNPLPLATTPYEHTAAPLPRSHVVLDLGSPRPVRSVELDLRDRYRDLGRRLAIETSVDGAAWTMGWEDWTGASALSGALEDQVRVPVRFPLGDVTARFLRIHPAEGWLIDALRVMGP